MTDDFDQRCYDPKTTFFGPDYPNPEVKTLPEAQRTHGIESVT